MQVVKGIIEWCEIMLVRFDEELAKYLLTYFVQFLVSKLVDSFSFFFQVDDRKDESWFGDDARVFVSVYPSFHSHRRARNSNRKPYRSRKI